MKLRLYSLLQSLCDLACAGLHGIERPFQRLREWAWTHATNENLKTCLTRSARDRQ